MYVTFSCWFPSLGHCGWNFNEVMQGSGWLFLCSLASPPSNNLYLQSVCCSVSYSLCFIALLCSSWGLKVLSTLFRRRGSHSHSLWHWLLLCFQFWLYVPKLYLCSTSLSILADLHWCLIFMLFVLSGLSCRFDVCKLLASVSQKIHVLSVMKS